MTNVILASAAGHLRIDLKKHLQSHHYNVIKELDSIRDLEMHYPVYKPDILVLDLFLSDGESSELINPILQKHPEAKIICLITSPSKETIFKVIKAGAKKVLPKPVDKDKLVDAIRTLMG